MILSVIQARLGSTRLPGKILMPIAGKPILQHVYDAAPEPKVVAMPFSDREVMGKSGFQGEIAYYNGDENDVLGRFYSIWQGLAFEADWILRLTADCPLLNRERVERFIKDSLYKHTWNTIITNRPWDPDGYDMELFSAKALAFAHEQAHESNDREHVTPWLYRHLNVRRFSIFGREPGPEKPEEKCSVDTLEDYQRVKELMETAQ